MYLGNILHGPKVPSADTGVIGGSYLRAVVMRVPATVAQPRLALALKCGTGYPLGIKYTKNNIINRLIYSCMDRRCMDRRYNV